MRRFWLEQRATKAQGRNAPWGKWSKQPPNPGRGRGGCGAQGARVLGPLPALPRVVVPVHKRHGAAHASQEDMCQTHAPSPSHVRALPVCPHSDRRIINATGFLTCPPSVAAPNRFLCTITVLARHTSTQALRLFLRQEIYCALFVSHTENGTRRQPMFTSAHAPMLWCASTRQNQQCITGGYTLCFLLPYSQTNTQSNNWQRLRKVSICYCSW